MIAKIKFPVPFHQLDHLIVLINVRESHWFPANMDVKFRRMRSYAYSSADYGRKYFCGNSTEWHGQSTLTPMPQLLLRTRLTEHTPVMVQALGKQKDVTVNSITRTLDGRIVAK